jgi:SET domain-containing protein
VEAKDADFRDMVMNYFEWDNETSKWRGPMVREMVERDVSYFWNHSCEPNCLIYNDQYVCHCHYLSAPSSPIA